MLLLIMTNSILSRVRCSYSRPCCDRKNPGHLAAAGTRLLRSRCTTAMSVTVLTSAALKVKSASIWKVCTAVQIACGPAAGMLHIAKVACWKFNCQSKHHHTYQEASAETPAEQDADAMLTVSTRTRLGNPVSKENSDGVSNWVNRVPLL